MHARLVTAKAPTRSMCASAFVLASTLSFAQTVNIVGLGASTCKEFNRDVQQNFHLQRDYFAWAQGFMSGILMRAPAGKDEGLRLNPPEFSLHKQIEFLRNFCLENPNNDFSDGVMELYRVLRGEQRS